MLTNISVKLGENALGGKGVSSNWVNYSLNKNKVRISLLQEEFLLSKKVTSQKTGDIETNENCQSYLAKSALGKEIRMNNSGTTEMKTRKEEMCHHSEHGMEIKDNPDQVQKCVMFFFLLALGNDDVNYEDRG